MPPVKPRQEELIERTARPRRHGWLLARKLLKAPLCSVVSGPRRWSLVSPALCFARNALLIYNPLSKFEVCHAVVGARGMPSTRPRVAFGALSVPSRASTRCFQRATFRALALEEQHAAAGDWLRLPGGGEVLLHYVMSSPATAAEAASLRSENETHRDLDALPVRHRESACAEKIFVWLSLASRSFAAGADFVGILDDDTFVHVERVFADLRPHTDNGRLLYGQFSWAERWDARRARHHGYANTGDLVLAAAARHVAAARGVGDGSGDGGGGGADGGGSGGRAGAGSPEARNGPFPLPLGFMMVRGRSLAPP